MLLHKEFPIISEYNEPALSCHPDEGRMTFRGKDNCYLILKLFLRN